MQRSGKQEDSFQKPLFLPAPCESRAKATTFPLATAGRRLYAEPARRLAARYREYFDAWRDRRAGIEHRDLLLGD